MWLVGRGNEADRAGTSTDGLSGLLAGVLDWPVEVPCFRIGGNLGSGRRALKHRLRTGTDKGNPTV